MDGKNLKTKMWLGKFNEKGLLGADNRTASITIRLVCVKYELSWI
jgi:hypothetical protein